MPRQLTEAQAWREIARRLEQEPRERDGGRHGLCLYVGDMRWDDDLISRPLYHAMVGRVHDVFNDGQRRGFLWPMRERDCRIIAAGLLAAMAEE